MYASNRLVCTGRFHLALNRRGKVVYEEETDNLITTVGENQIAARMVYSGSALGPRYIGFGSGGTAATKAQTALVAEASVARQSSTATSSANVLTLTWAYVPAGTITGIVEVGVFDALTVGNMFSRAVVSSFNMTASDSLAVTWALTFLGLD